MSLHPPREASRATSEGLIISKYPNVCRAPKAAIPFTTIAYQHHHANTASSVFMTGQRAHKQGSIVTKCMGDEPGVGLGVKSNTVSSICHRKEHSKTVRIEGEWATRDTDEWGMNNWNTTGKLCWPKDDRDFDPTPPLSPIASKSSGSDEGRVMSDASPVNDWIAGAEYAQSVQAAQPAPQPQQNQPVSRPNGSGSPITPQQPQGDKPKAGPPLADNNNKPEPPSRWWRLVQMLQNTSRINPSGPGAMEAMAFADGWLQNNVHQPQDWYDKGFWIAPPKRLDKNADNGVPTGSEVPSDYASLMASQRQDEKPDPHRRTVDNTRIASKKGKKDEKEEKKCDCITGTYTYVLSRCKAECGEEFQAHHIVADKCLGVSNRADREAGKGRIPTPEGMNDLPSFNNGPAICLFGNASVQQTQHNTAHGNDRQIAAEGRQSSVKNTLPLERVRSLSEEAAIKAREDCADHIRAAVAKGFDGIDPQTLLRSCRNPIKPGSPAYDLLAPKPLPSP